MLSYDYPYPRPVLDDALAVLVDRLDNSVVPGGSSDIFRSRDMGGWGKALWTIFVIVLPFLGVFVYLIARGQSMAERDLDETRTRASGVPVLRSRCRRLAGAEVPLNSASPSSPV